MKNTISRKALAGSTALLAAFALFGSAALPAQAATANSKVLTFETADTVGLLAVGTCPASDAHWACAFEGAATTQVDAPAGNNGGKALQITKSGQPWAGVNLYDGSTDGDTSIAGVVSLNVFSPETVNTPFQIQLVATDNSTTNAAVELVPGWNHVSADMASANGYDATKTYQKLVVFPDFVNGGDVPSYAGAPAAAVNNQNYAIDDVAFNGGVTPAIGASAPINATAKVLSFETADADGALAVGTCPAGDGHWACAFEGAITSVVNTPAGGNAGKSLQITKSGQPWAGVNLYDASGAHVKIAGSVTMNFFSPDTAKSPAQLQLVATDNSTANAAVEVSPGWNHLTFDMANAHGYDAAKTYQKMVIFPDFVNSGDVPGYSGAAVVAVNNQNYAIDDVAINGGVTPALPVVVVTVKPAVRVAATVSGTAKVGKTLTAGKGSYTGSTATYSYKWYRCTVVAKTTGAAAPAAAAKCSVIAGATTASHKVVTADVGKYLRVLVTARNSAGSALSLSKTTTAKATK
jgi:hypothetical protein